MADTYQKILEVYQDKEDGKYIAVTSKYRSSCGRRLVTYNGWIFRDGAYVRHGIYGQSCLKHWYRKLTLQEVMRTVPDLFHHAAANLY